MSGAEQAFCGCCGDEIGPDDEWWCYVCAEHVLAYGPMWERTFFARYGAACPFQV